MHKHTHKQVTIKGATNQTHQAQVEFGQIWFNFYKVQSKAYMQKTCDVAGKAILAKINLRKKCVNRDKM